MWLDTRIGLAWQACRKPRVRALHGLLVACEPAPGIAWRFRQGQLLCSDGALEAADGCLNEVIAHLRGQEGSEAGIAAARTELAEIDLLGGHPGRALDAFEKATALHEASGRRSLAYRSEAGRVRAAVEAGLDALTTGVEEGLVYARDRNLGPMAVDLRIALGTALADRFPTGAAEVLSAAARRPADRIADRRRSRALRARDADADARGPAERVAGSSDR